MFVDRQFRHRPLNIRLNTAVERSSAGSVHVSVTVAAGDIAPPAPSAAMANDCRSTIVPQHARRIAVFAFLASSGRTD